MIGDGRVCKGFGVGVADEEANAFDILAIHVANGVSAAATDTDDFDDGYGGFGFLGGSDFHKGLEVFLFVGLGGVIRHGVGFVPNRRWMIGEGGGAIGARFARVAQENDDRWGKIRPCE